MRIRLPNITLFIDTAGTQYVPNDETLAERPTVIAVHGGPGVFDHTYLKPVLMRVANAYVIFVDLRGHGRSDHGSPEDWNTARWARDLRELCEAIGLNKPIVLGHSAGGFVAQRFAIEYPNDLAALILLNSTPRLDVDGLCSAFERRGGAAARAAAEAFWSNPNAGSLDRYVEICAPLYNRKPDVLRSFAHCRPNPEVLFRFFSPNGEGRLIDFRHQLGHVNCRTLVVSGELDPIATPGSTRELLTALPEGLVSHRHFKDCGHDIEFDDPAGLLHCLEEFARSCRALASAT